MSQSNDDKVVYFAKTDARNKEVQFGIKKRDRSRHMYAIGKTGMGKSTLLENLAVQDIQNGDGICFIDPHGKSADLLLEYVPKERIKDVIYFAPFDMDYPVSFNVMEDVGPEKRYLVASGLMASFKKIWVDAWSARMEYILGNIMLALLEYPGSTLVGVNRMLTDKDFRKEVVSKISDPSVRSFWVNEYASYTDKFAAEAAPAIQNKVGQFIANPLIRNIIGQEKSSFDIRKVMDEKKILIINLSKGRVGEANANLLGSMLITKIYLGAMSRADLNEKELAEAPNFYLYVDEFQSFANESFADILSEARKYKLNLTIAHQYIEQMTEEVRAAVFGNVGSMCVFRVGAYDAEILEKEFAPQFTAEDIVNLQKYQMYLKLMIDGVTSPPFSASGMAPIPKPEQSYVQEIIESSRALYAKPRSVIEEEILRWHEIQFGKQGGGQGGSQSGGGSSRGASQGASNGSSGGSGQNYSQGQNSGRLGQGQSRNPQSNISNAGANNRPYQSNHTSSGSNPGHNGQMNTHPQNRMKSQNTHFGQSASNGAVGSSNGNVRIHEPHLTPKEAQSKTQSDNQRENEFRKAISLNYLRPDNEPKADTAKAPRPENIAALREALLSVMNNAESRETKDLPEHRDLNNTQNIKNHNPSFSSDDYKSQKTSTISDRVDSHSSAHHNDNHAHNHAHNHTSANNRNDNAHDNNIKTGNIKDTSPSTSKENTSKITEEELKKLLDIE